MSGWRWAVDVAEKVHLVLFAATLILGVAIDRLFVHRPLWTIIGVVFVLFLAVLLEGTYRVWSKSQLRLETTQGELAALRPSKLVPPLTGRLEVGKTSTTAILRIFNDGDGADFEAEVVDITGAAQVQPDTHGWTLLWDNGERRMTILRNSSAGLRLVDEFSWPMVQTVMDGHYVGSQWRFAGVPDVRADLPLDIDRFNIKEKQIRLQIRLHRVEPSAHEDHAVVLSVPAYGQFDCRVEPWLVTP